MSKLSQFAAACAAVVCAFSAIADTIYVKADAGGVGDGSSWADAYTDVASAIAAANETGDTVYIAKGVYPVASVMSVTNIPAIYGGFLGESEDETVEGRQFDVNKTVLSGDKDNNDYWCHIEPGAVGSYSFTKTELKDKPLFKDGELQLPPDFTGDYDGYVPNIDTANATAVFSIKNGIAGVIDGLWCAGFCGDSTAFVTFQSGTKAVDLVNCRFLGNTSHSATIKNSDDSSNKKLIGCKVMFTGIRITAPWGDNVSPGVNLGTGGTLVPQDCDFVSLVSTGEDAMWKQWSGFNVLCFKRPGADWAYNLQMTVRDCRFVRNFALQRAPKTTPNILALTSGNNWESARFVDCVFSNNLSVAAKTDAKVLDFPNCNLEMIGCSFVNNRHDEKGGSTRNFSFLGNGGSNSRWQFFNSCSFVGNAYHVTNSSLTDGSMRVSMFLLPDDNQQSGFINCVFDSNKMSAVVPDGVKAVLCRGVVVYCGTANTSSQTSITGCTFLGPREEGVCDVHTMADHSQPIRIVDSIFEYTGGEPYDGLDIRNPAVVSLESCTLANWVAPDVEYAIANHDYDWIPFATNIVAKTGRPVLVPAAKTEKLRDSADIAFNGATFKAAVNSAPNGWITNFAFRAKGAATWLALNPKFKALDADVSENPDKYVAHDAIGATRPYGATTRGASETLTEAAENGGTLVLRRDPFKGGTFSGPQTQAVAPGERAVPVTVTATDASAPFAGWYDEAGEFVSDSATLDMGELTGLRTLTAKFAVAKVKLTFDLGEHGTFVESGERTYSVDLVPGSEFPEVPAFTADEGYVFADWHRVVFPVVVPETATTYSARFVTTAMRTIFVVPAAEAMENPDGLGWDSAFGSVADACAEAAIGQGEVWVKEGVYMVAKTIPLKANVTVRGGFAGDETSAVEADPVAHPTILWGDVNKNDYWKGSSGASRGYIFKDGVLNRPDPDMTTDNYWAVNSGETVDDTYSCFAAEESVENVGFFGLTFVGFQRSVVSDTYGGESTLVVSNCDFVANVTGVGSGYAALKTSGRSVAVGNCRFLGNYSALALTVPTGRTAMISDCCFDANIATEGGAGGVYLAGAGAVDVASCAFNRNYAAQSMYTRQSAGVWCAMSSGATAMFADCTFATNCVSDLSFGSFGMSGAAAVTVCRAKFTANKCVNPRADSWLAMTAAPSAPSACFTVYHSGKLLVKDSYFGDNTLVGGQNDLRAAVLASLGGETAFVNCTVENCAVGSHGQPSGVFGVRANSKLGLVNCLVRGTTLTGATSGIVTYYDELTDASVGIVNTAFWDDVKGFHGGSAGKLGLASSSIATLETTNGLAVAYCYETVSNGVTRTVPTKIGPNGAWAGAVTAAVRGRKVWERGNTVYFYDEVANAAKPWRKVSDTTSFAASVSGLDQTMPVIPDAFGDQWPHNHNKVGPRHDRQGLMLIVR